MADPDHDGRVRCVAGRDIVASCGRRADGPGGDREVHDVRHRRTAGGHAEDVRPDRRPEAARQREDRRHQGQPDGRTRKPCERSTGGRHALHAPAGDCGDGPPDWQGRRAPHPGAGEPDGNGRADRGVHRAGELAAARHPGRRRERRVREHQLPGQRQEVLAAHSPQRRSSVPGLRPQPLVRGLRRVSSAWPR